MKTTRLDTHDSDFIERLSALTAWSEERDEEVGERVRAILRDVAGRGDAAVVEYTNRFDRREAESLADLTVERDQLEAALARLPAEQRDALQAAAERVRDYHERQKQESWSYRDAHGTLLGQQVTALDRAGIYVPGGKAAYPSSVLMNALPAHVAGVGEIVMVSPAPDGELDDMVLAAAAVAGVERFFTVGGAQAVAALAFGTESIPAVDKIVGPGNIYVAEAKRQVFGKVGIDMIAGPSEILVVCDGHTDPDWIAMDLFSQAEHDEEAQAILVSPDADFLERVAEAMERLAPTLEREAIIRTSMANRGALILARDLDDAFEVVNRISPEHLELSMDDAGRWAKKVRHAGAIFLGRHTPEALGDYCAGPNHVLPTSATARFSSPLGVYDFQKRSSLIGCSPEGASALAGVASVLARGERLTAHARSAELRIKK
ncbi:histidinol dehydrogenase [Alcanivorax sp. 521-1]|uniref:Histidinol dehydrogenase n=1 Tax=Alloalcanivorax profundimaris TaxID=2735259 RepID=A0ABS0ANQ5_9GAMM|nr:histidinol dehydrogenase [Alloalcanivorax profundimaris]MBF5055252.1 histidinol dehydrogenase [Alloalcanivorax profundimaris]MBM1143235.1 histidinol dehydrogenase [Alcanivorax sp. ZXX171]UWN49011.1 Histidinol dehydrogenase [Alcanivorax sp. ALC70]